MSDSPPETEVEVAEGTSSTPDAEITDVKSESSPAPAETLTDAIYSVLRKSEASPTSQAPEKLPAGATPEIKSGEGEELPEDIKSLQPKSQQRFRELASQVKERDAQLESLRPRAEEWEKLEKFVAESGISYQDLGNLLQIGLLLRHDPASALQRLSPIVNYLEGMLGEVLPPELRQQVEQGYLTEEYAKALVKANANAQLAKQQATEAQQRYQDDTTRREQQALVDNTVHGVENWEKQKAERDPDWHLKRELIATNVAAAISDERGRRGSGWFPTTQEAIQLSENALKATEQWLVRVRPKPASVVPLNSGGASSRSEATPKSIEDIIHRTIGR